MDNLYDYENQAQEQDLADLIKERRKRRLDLESATQEANQGGAIMDALLGMGTSITSALSGGNAQQDVARVIGARNNATDKGLKAKALELDSTDITQLGKLAEMRRKDAQSKRTLEFVNKKLEKGSEEKAEDRELKKTLKNVEAGQKEAAANEKQNQEMDKRVLKLSDKLAPAQTKVQAFKDIDEIIGKPLEQYDPNKDDLPGVSIPGIGRVSAFNADARRFQGAADKIFNVELRDRSGAAVTNQEMERLKNEFNSGKFNSEADIVLGLSKYKRALAQELKNREAAFGGSEGPVVQKYRMQGGTTSSDLGVDPRGSLPNWSKAGQQQAAPAQSPVAPGSMTSERLQYLKQKYGR